MKGGAIRKWLAKAISDAQFSNLLHKLFVTSADLDTLEQVVFESGSVADAVHASMAMPGVIVPVELNGRTLIDGGAAEPVPVSPLVDVGVEHIIAVNTIPNPEEMRACVLASREQKDAPRRRRGKKSSTFDQYINYFAPGNILDVMMKSMHGGQSRMAEQSCSRANVTLRPVSCDGKWNDFGNARWYIQIGRKETEENLEELLTMARLKVEKVT